jgi:outer membrane protein assembly factor BamC
VAKVRIERSGNQRWLVVPEIPEKVWPTVKEFWQESGFLVNLELLEAGVMETDWAENRAKIPQDALRNFLGKVLDGMYSTSERDKFRTRLERGTEAGTTEIYISHRGVQEVFTNQRQERSVWQPRPSDPELEAEFLRRLMSRFGVEDQRAKAQVAAAEAPQRVKLLPAKDGAGALDLQEPFDRAWRRVGLALDRVGFTVEDRDRSKGTYFVRYVDPDIDAQNRRQEDSALGKLMFWRSNKPAQSALQYSVFLKAGGQDTTEVRVLNKDGVSENSENSRKILALLFDQLK